MKLNRRLKDFWFTWSQTKQALIHLLSSTNKENPGGDLRKEKPKSTFIPLVANDNRKQSYSFWTILNGRLKLLSTSGPILRSRFKKIF